MKVIIVLLVLAVVLTSTDSFSLSGPYADGYKPASGEIPSSEWLDWDEAIASGVIRPKPKPESPADGAAASGAQEPPKAPAVGNQQPPVATNRK